MGSTLVAAILLLLLLATVPTTLAVTFQVGDDSGWSSGVDYTAWLDGKTFRVGDTLEFKYGPSHSVSIVDKVGFDSCSDSGATQSFSGGDTKIDLTTVGTIHFLCPVPGHCISGMKLAVPVLAAASTPSSPPPPPPLPRSPPPLPQSPPPLPRSPPPLPRSPPLAPRSTPKPKLLPPSPSPSASPPAKSLSPAKVENSKNVASKGVMSYRKIVVMIVIMYGLLN